MYYLLVLAKTTLEGATIVQAAGPTSERIIDRIPEHVATGIAYPNGELLCYPTLEEAQDVGRYLVSSGLV